MRIRWGYVPGRLALPVSISMEPQEFGILILCFGLHFIWGDAKEQYYEDED